MNAVEIEVFATGTHTSKQGVTRVWTRDDLVEKATEFNSRSPREKAPATIGHPVKDSQPAYGWAESFSVKDRLDEKGEPISVLVGSFSDFVPEFVDAVKAGFFRERSLGMRDGKIHHVAWLGAVPPAVKGLQPFSFSAGDLDDEWSESIEEFGGDFRITTVAGLLRRVREYLIETDGAEVAERVVPSEELDRLASEPYDDTEWLGRRLERLEGLVEGLSTAHYNPSLFSEGDMDPNKKTDDGAQSADDFSAQLAERDTKISTLETKNSVLETQLNEQGKIIEQLRAKNQESEFSAFLASDDVKNRITPALRPIAMQMLKDASKVDGADFEFSEGTETKKGTAIDVAKATIRTWPELNFSELATNGTSTRDNANTGFEMGKNDSPDPERRQIAARARQIAKEKDISFAEAVDYALEEISD